MILKTEANKESANKLLNHLQKQNILRKKNYHGLSRKEKDAVTFFTLTERFRMSNFRNNKAVFLISSTSQKCHFTTNVFFVC